MHLKALYDVLLTCKGNKKGTYESGTKQCTLNPQNYKIEV